MVNPINIYSFGLGGPITETTPDILGGKGAGLVWMSSNGLPVPPGFIIPTPVWAQYKKSPKTTMKEIAKAIVPYLDLLNQHFGYMPLLAVRSGARVSCPGMMDTILNVGLGMDEATADLWLPKLGADCYRDSLHRLITMYGSVVKGMDKHAFDTASLADAFGLYKSKAGENFPNAKTQLLDSIEAVFKSWENDRAKTYRKLNDIPAEWGTAVVVQAMVFGNLNDQSGTGVLFTRNPDTGENLVKGEFAINAQGEDVVDGSTTPLPLSQLAVWNKEVSIELMDLVTKLETLKKDVQDVEFTIQDGKLYLLQTRNAKRSAVAAVRIALDMQKEGLISKRQAINRVTAKEFDLAQKDVIDPKFDTPEFCKGIAACSGVAIGKPVFSAEDAVASKEPCILITQETNPDDVAGMNAAQAVVTMTGGETCHAAVVARNMNKPCVVGVGLELRKFLKASLVAVDGGTGRIWLGSVPVVSGKTGATLELIAAYTKLVMDVLEATPVITQAPATMLKQALAYLGEDIYDTAKAVATVVSMSNMVETLYLDLTPPQDEARSTFQTMFGGFDAKQALVDAMVLNTFDHKIIIVGKVNTALPTLAFVNDLTNLIVSEEKEAVLDGLDPKNPAVAKVLGWKSKEGLEVVAVGSLVAGSKSFVSVEQALQLVTG